MYASKIPFRLNQGWWNAMPCLISRCRDLTQPTTHRLSGVVSLLVYLSLLCLCFLAPAKAGGIASFSQRLSLFSMLMISDFMPCFSSEGKHFNVMQDEAEWGRPQNGLQSTEMIGANMHHKMTPRTDSARKARHRKKSRFVRTSSSPCLVTSINYTTSV